MGGMAIPLLEGVAVRVLTALGVGVAAGTAGEVAREAARKRQEEADRARASPIARTDAQTRNKEKCKECPPDKGVPWTRSFSVRKDWVDYQARIGGMPNGPTFIIEWDFNGVKFDGFVSGQCLLKEAKGGYDRFFNEWGEALYWWEHNIEGMMKEVSDQSIAAISRPPVRLEWFWQEHVSHRFFSKVLGPIAPDVPHHFSP